MNSAVGILCITSASPQVSIELLTYNSARVCLTSNRLAAVARFVSHKPATKNMPTGNAALQLVFLIQDLINGYPSVRCYLAEEQ